MGSNEEQSVGTGAQTFLRRRESLVAQVPNPFENNAPWTRWEKTKVVILGPTLFVVRVVVLILAATVQLLLARIVTIGVPLEEDRGCLYHKKPLRLWRRLLLSPLVITNRIILWCFGFWHIRVVDRRKDRSVRPNVIVVAPHVTFTDPFIIAYAFPPLPAAVGKAELLKIPLLQSLYVAGQAIFVDRRNAKSRHACKDAIAMRADPDKWDGAPTMIFPEGTTTNGRMLIQFKLGPFCPGQPVLPVLLRYPHKHYDVSWVGRNSSLPMLVLRMMLQFSNSCTVEVLEPYVPSEAEKHDPSLFAKNVRQVMARNLSVGTTEHTYDDLFLSIDASRLGVGSDFEVREIVEKYEVSTEQLTKWLHRFHSYDKDGDGCISHQEFEEVIRGEGFSLSEEAVDNLFAFFDTDQNGTIQYREFVQVVALLSGKCSTMSRTQLAFLVHDVEGKGRVKRDVLRKSLNASVAVTRDAEGLPLLDTPGEQLVQSPSANAGSSNEEVGFEEFRRMVDQDPSVLDRALERINQRLRLVSDAQ